MNIIGITDTSIFFNEVVNDIIERYYYYDSNKWLPDGRIADAYYWQFTSTPDLHAVYTAASNPEAAKLEFPELFV